MSSSDLVAIWDVPLVEYCYKIELDHGTTSGKRIVKVNDKIIIKKDWLFKLVGCEQFEIGEEKKVKCEIVITSNTGFSYQYKLLLNGEKLNDFKRKQQKKMVVWYCIRDEKRIRVALDKETLDVWLSGKKADVDSIFIENGTEIVFSLTNENNQEAAIKVVSSGKKREGIIYNLFVNNHQIPESIE